MTLHKKTKVPYIRPWFPLAYSAFTKHIIQKFYKVGCSSLAIFSTK